MAPFLFNTIMKINIILLLLLLEGARPIYAQDTHLKQTSLKELSEQVIAFDNAVFDAFNNCEIEKFKSYFTNDAKFYHDKGGKMVTAASITESVRKNICGNPLVKVRRELIPATVQVYPMDNYGAIITGEHLFYQTTDGKEKLTGRAKFTHLCEFKDNIWKIHRVLSYDHRGIQ